MHALMASVSMFAAPFCVLLVLLGRLLILPIIQRSVLGLGLGLGFDGIAEAVC